MRPPREEGWFAEDLDRLPEAPRHTGLIDGALVFMTSPQRWWHGHLVTMLTVALMEQAPADVRVGREMTIRLDQHNRPEPDLLVTTADYDGDRTWHAAVKRSHVEAECLRSDPDLRRSLTEDSDLGFPGWHALAPDGHLRVSCGLAADWPGVPRQRNPWHAGGTCNETAQVSDSYPYPCCGHRVLSTMPGSYEICPVCFWEDDGVQFRWPTMAGGTNKVSLIEAHRNYQDFGACDQRSWRYVRLPAEDEPRDPAWRPIDLTRDSFEGWAAEDRARWPDDHSVLCWWLPTFWRRDHP